MLRVGDQSLRVLDHAAPLPLYAQIAARLRAQVAAGDYLPGARLPGEHELAAHFQVGRPTVRQATEMLVRERVLERRRGSGTYVNEAPREVDLLSAAGTLASFAESGIALSTRIVARPRRRTIPADAAQPFAGRSVYVVVRRGSVDRVPVLLEEMYFDPEFFPGLEQRTLAQRSIAEIAREEYFLRPESAEQRFSVQPLDGPRAALLMLPPPAFALKIERTIDFHGAPRALFAELYCRTDQVVFTQRVALGQEAMR